MCVGDEKKIPCKSHAEQAEEVSEDINPWVQELQEQSDRRCRNVEEMNAQEDSQILHEPIGYVEEMRGIKEGGTEGTRGKVGIEVMEEEDRPMEVRR